MEFFNEVLDFLRSLHSADGLRNLVQAGGILVLVAIVFAETGLLVGFFLPGDSLLVTAGIFAASNGAGGPGIFDLPLLLISLIIAAVVGDQVGFVLGRKTGPMIFTREDSLLFKMKHVRAAHEFYEKHGGRALILARFIPIFRTFVPFSAGVAKMEYKSFVRYNVVGGVAWVLSMILLGYFLGLTPLANQLHKIILVVIVVSCIPLMKSGYTFTSRKIRNWAKRSAVSSV
jgi:membrane-associated protein